MSAATRSGSRAEDVLAGLDEEQRTAAQAVTGPVCILAGAGTGKTRTITHRIAYGVHTGVYVPEQVLAVTFTARAAGELRTRLQALDVGGVQARTFHAAAMRQLRYFAPRVLGGPMPPLIEKKLRVVATAAACIDCCASALEIMSRSAPDSMWPGAMPRYCAAFCCCVLDT